MPSKLKKAIGAVKDQTSISLAKVASNNTSKLEVAVLKATSHEDIPIDERHIQQIVQLVSSSKIYAAACARAIGKRIGRTRNWIVALKSLMIVLRLFQDGDPYFPREVLHAMKGGAKILNLSSFRDDSNSSSPWDFTAFVRTFALYLDERLDCFLTGKLQRRYTCVRDSHHRNRGTNEPVRDMKPAMLLDRISHWQRLLERAIATRATGVAKTNRLIQTCLYAIVQESFDFYKDISDGLALLLDSFFHLQYQNCVAAFQTCVRATKQFKDLSIFYSSCKGIGVGRTSEYPSVQTISEELIETLREFLKDQSSFPASSKSPNRPILRLPAPSPPSRISTSRSLHDSLAPQSPPSRISTSRSLHHSYGGHSRVSSYSEGTSEFGSQSTSLEDLISATEAYNNDHLEKEHSQSYIASQSCPALVSLEEPIESTKEDEWSHEQEKNDKKLQSASSANGWDLMLIEALSGSFHKTPNASTQSAQSLPDLATPSENGEKAVSTSGWELALVEGNGQRVEEEVSTSGWELALVETTTQPVEPRGFSISTMDDSYNKASVSVHQYNPFLQDPMELPGYNTQPTFSTGNMFSSAPTFQATPSFSAQNLNSMFQNDDPFGV